MSIDLENSWLAVDVGNSRIKLGLFRASQQAREIAKSDAAQSAPANLGKLPECVDFESASLKSALEWDKLFDGKYNDQSNAEAIRTVIVGSNQHGVNRIVKDWPGWLRQPIVIRNSESFPIGVQVDEPRRVGLDRLLNAVAADSIRNPDQEVIIVDCGTATTIDLVSSSGSFCGGAILPGFTLCARALNQYTEVLPLISMDELFNLPPSEDCHPALGSNTQSAIMSGVFWGQIGAVRELMSRLSPHQTSGKADQPPPELLLTGGGARLLVPYFENSIHCPYLPLQGLVLAADQQS